MTTAQKWAWSFTDLPKFDKSQEIVYTITIAYSVAEVSVPKG
ncbi:Cna B-type domain-containing protein [Trueperella pyogenes]